MKEVTGVLALAVTLALFIPYVRSVLAGRTRPHVFSWLIWGFGTCAVASAQISAGGGYGGWVILVSGLISIYIGHIAFRHKGDRAIRSVDWSFVALALIALPAWALTDDPLWAVALLTLADLLGFGPTVRNAFQNPFDEPVWFYMLAAGRNALVVLSLESLSWTTGLFPVSIGVACLLMATLLIWLRRVAIRRPTT